MSLTPEQVMQDAEELVTDLCTGLATLNMTGQNETNAYADAKLILIEAAKIIDAMVLGSQETIHQEYL